MLADEVISSVVLPEDKKLPDRIRPNGSCAENMTRRHRHPELPGVQEQARDIWEAYDRRLSTRKNNTDSTGTGGSHLGCSAVLQIDTYPEVSEQNITMLSSTNIARQQAAVA